MTSNLTAAYKACPVHTPPLRCCRSSGRVWPHVHTQQSPGEGAAGGACCQHSLWRVLLWRESWVERVCVLSLSMQIPLHFTYVYTYTVILYATAEYIIINFILFVSSVLQLPKSSIWAEIFDCFGLEQCLVHNRHSINIWWMNEWMNERVEMLWHLMVSFKYRYKESPRILAS